MSQDDALRMTAEVVDKFTGPLGALKKQMQALAAEGGVHTDTLTKGFGKIEGGARAAEKAVASGLNPALSVVGITGLSAAAAVSGVAVAMRNFAAGAASLGALSRETGQTADNLRILGAVAGKFGIEQESVASGTKAFAAQMREFGRGIGETYQWLNRQGRDEAGRKHFQDFAADLRATTDRGEQLRKVLREMENIQDPTERGMFAEKFFGSADFGRLGDKHFGPILEMWKRTAQKLGPLDPAAVKSAEDFERTMSDLRTSMQKLGTVVGQEVLPYASQFTTWLSDIVGGQRSDVTKALREGLGEIRKELDAIDWKSAGEQAKGFFTGSIGFANDLVKALKAAATLLGALKDLKDGNVAGALGRLGEADKLTDLGMGQGRAPGTIQDQMRGDTGALMQRQQEAQNRLRILDEQIARKEQGFDATGENRVVATDERAKRERLIDETRRLSDEIRRLREDPAKKGSGDATAQKSAFDVGGGQFGGATVQRASLGGLAGAARAGQYLGGGGGIVLPGGGGGYGGGGTGTSAGGGDRLFGGPGGVDIGEGMRGRPFGAPKAGSGAEAAGRALRGGDQSGAIAANPGAYKDVLDHIAKSEGTANQPSGGYNTSLGYGKYLPGGKEQNLTSMTLEQISDLGRYMRRQPGNPNSSALGRYQIVGDTLRSQMKKLGLKGSDLFDEKTQDLIGANLARQRGANSTGLRQEWASLVGERNRKAVELMQKVDPSASTMPLDRPSQSSGAAQAGDMLRSGGSRPDGSPEPTDGRGVNSDLIRTLKRAQELSDVPFHIHEGARSLERQKEMVARGWSKTLDSEHLKGRAVDIRADGDPAVGKLNRERYAKIADAMRRASRETGTPVEWGGGWKSFPDVPHFQLPKGYKSDASPYAGDIAASSGMVKRAIKSGAAGGGQGADGQNGQLDVRIHNPGPGTHATVEPKGSIFREIQQTRGRQMQAAGEDV